MDTIFGWLILIAFVVVGAVGRGLMINWWKKQPNSMYWVFFAIWIPLMIWAIATR